MTEKNVIWWEKEREQGKFYWIAKTAFIWGILFFILNNLISWFLALGTSLSPAFLFFSIIGGFFVGISSWLGNERKYQNHLLENKVEKELKH